MLLSIMSPIVISSSAISSSAITMITTPTLPRYGVAMVSSLVVALFLKEILSSSQKWDKYVDSSFKIIVVPFTFTLVAITLFIVLGYGY